MQSTALGKAAATMKVKVTRANGDVEHLEGKAIAEYQPVYVVMECMEADGKLHPQKQLVVSAEDAEAAFSENLIIQLRKGEA